MVRSVLSLALAALTLIPSTTASYYQEVEDGPNVLDECLSCPYLYKTFYTCARSVSQPTRTNVGDCACPPRPSEGSDNGWYPYIETCAGCLPSKETGDIWNNMGTLFWQMVNICRGDRNITSDAEGVLCVGSEKFQSCMALRDASEGPSWASYQLFGYSEHDSNKTKVLNLAAFKPNTTSSEAAASTTAKTTASGTATGLASAAASTTAPAGTATGAGNQPAASTTASSPAAAGLGQGSPAGYVLGGLVVAGVLGLL